MPTTLGFWQYRSVREYQVLVWRSDLERPRIVVWAENIAEARELLRAEYGPDTLCSLWNEEDPQDQLDEIMPLFAERARSLKRRKAELKKRHWETWSAVKRAVDGADPEQLLAMGCPNDEYDNAVVYLTDKVLARDHLTRESLSGWFRTTYGSNPDDEAIRVILDSLEAIR